MGDKKKKPQQRHVRRFKQRKAGFPRLEFGIISQATNRYEICQDDIRGTVNSPAV